MADLVERGRAALTRSPAPGSAIARRGHRGERPSGGTAGRWAEHAAALLLGSLVLVVHNVGYLLGQSFWNDEAWVAVTTRFPLSELPATTSSTPIGWSLLLRMVTFDRSQSGRLLPLAFAGAAVVAGYWLARQLDWTDRASAVIAGLLAGCGVLLVPAMLFRDNLKQYTADACLALLVVAVTSRLERRWSRAGLALLSVTVAGGMLVSAVAPITGAVALAAICLVQVARRAWARLAEAAVASCSTAVLAAAIYKAFDARAVVPGLQNAWRADFLPVRDGVHAAATFVVGHVEAVRAGFGLGPAWLGVPLVLAGLVTIFRLGRPATALAIAALWPEMLALSALRTYPFLNQRTSTFLFAITAAVAAIGVAGICAAVRGWLRARLHGGAGTLIAAAAAMTAAAVALAAFGLAARPYLRGRTLQNEDVRDQALYVAAHAGRRDPIVVNMSSNWGFAYYWPTGQPASRPDSVVRQGYEAYFPDQPRIVVARDRDAAAISAALSTALAAIRPGGCTRIWLVRTHVSAAEQAAWTAVLGRLRLAVRPVADGLGYIQAGPPSCRRQALGRIAG